jgi:hypothetical protein
MVTTTRHKINGWEQIIAGIITGPYELPPHLSDASCLHFLREKLPQLLEDVTLTMTQLCDLCIYAYDEAPAHVMRDVKPFLDSHYPNPWTAVFWRPQSPDLTPADYLWGHLKGIVYSKKANTRDEL